MAEDELATDSIVEDNPYFGTQELNPGRLRKRRSETWHRISEMRAAEGEDERPIPAAAAPARSQSCPKLPHRGRGHAHSRSADLVGAPPRPLGPRALSGQLPGPPPPRCAPPCGLPRGPRPGRARSAEPRSPSQSSPGPFRGIRAKQYTPYLQELQAFAAHNEKRAMEESVAIRA
ncbi:unnamed protein product [Prorocentrum cordatum]|uniref:Uncharacterized protein n=1 Tax=Prorocentrum cordatum TaxID=2364126 RepID=A0ABN9Y359_9DINO|nr:unnamed protein product [Polarella glacialis]